MQLNEHTLDKNHIEIVDTSPKAPTSLSLSLSLSHSHSHSFLEYEICIYNTSNRYSQS